MNITLKNRIKKHAHEGAPNEVCGIIYTSGSNLFIKKCDNISRSPHDSFEISNNDFLECNSKGLIIGIYHSHDENCAFSESDIISSEELALPYYLYAVKEDRFSIYFPKEYTPEYVGREFIFGVNDCYTLVREFYRRELGIPMSDYDADFDYESKEVSNFENNWEKEGFELKTNIKDINVGDVLVFKINKKFPQHVGIYLGKNQFLHHPLKSQSRIEPISRSWAGCLVGYLQHKNKRQILSSLV